MSTQWRRTKISNISLTILYLEGFLSRLGFGVITFTLPFLALSLGMSFTEIGMLAALRLLAAIALKPLMGTAADRFGKRNIYLLSIAGRIIVCLLFILASAPWMLFAIRFLHGVSSAARDPVAAYLITEHGASHKMATSFAWYGTARELGAVFGYLMAGAILTLSMDNYAYAFTFALITSIISLLLVFAFVKEAANAGESQAGSESIRAYSINANWVEIALLGGMMALTGSMVSSLFPLIATEFAQLSKAETSMLYALSSVAIMLLGPVFGWLSDHVSRHAVLALRSLANAVSSLLYLFWPTMFGFGLARMTDEAGKAAFRPAWGALMAEYSLKTSSRKRGQRIAYLDNAQSTGEALGPIFAGALWDHLGIAWLFAIRIILSLLSEFYYVALIRRRVIAQELTSQ